MVIFIMDNGKIIKNMAMDSRPMLMAILIKGSIVKEGDKAEEHIIINRGNNILASGKIIKNMELEP